jgi:ribosomal subunit interface protein
MQVVITGKQITVGEALRGHVEKELADTISKYFEHAIEASVVLSPEGKGKQVRADISVHIGRNIQMQGHAESHEAKAAFDAALERIAKRLRRQKRRLRDHQKAGQEI